MSRFRLFYHFVWATKFRTPLVTDMNRDAIYSAISAKTKELKGIVHAINGMSDHIHVVATIPPSIALSKFVGMAKGSSSHLANHLTTADSDGSFQWQESFGVVSISETHLPVVVRYVVNQQKHHGPDGKLDARLEAVD
jgi:putative transposase